MKRASVVIVLVVSLIANAALVAAFVLRAGSKTDAQETSVASNSASAADAPTNATANKSVAVEAVHASPGVRADTWSKLGSGDMPTLVANLRAAGFPPKLVRAIVSSIVSDQFAERRRAIRGDLDEAPYWKPRGAPFDISKQADLRALYREQSDLVKSLVGDEPPSDEMRQAQRRMYGPLPADKLDMVSRINSDYAELSMQTRMESNGIMLPWDREQLAMIEKEKRADLEATLTPEELEMFDLYSSQTANSLRSRLAQFNVTEQEFRALYDLQRPFDEKYSFVNGPPDPSVVQERAAAQRQLNEQIKATLGDERYAEYQRAQDYGYRTASRIAERLKLPQENAAAVYDLQKSVQAQVNEIRRANSGDAAARDAALSALADDANQRVVSLLGQQGAEAYTQSGGSWLRNLARGGRGPVIQQSTIIRQIGP